MDFFERLSGVFFNPRKTFEGLADKPTWPGMLIVVLVILVTYTLVVSPYTRHDQLQMMKESVKLKERVGEERYNQQLRSLEGPVTTAQIVQTAVFTPLWFVVAALLQALILLMMGRFVTSQGTFKQVFSALVHASLINVLLGNALRLGLIFVRKSTLQTSTSLTVLFPRMEVMSTASIILSQVDVFQLWMFGILAFGLSAAFKVDLKKSLFISYSVWVLKALANIAISLVGMSFIR
jgi:hypothetical protein